MRIRLLLVACAALPVLAFAAPALATYKKPRLVVDESSYGKGAASTAAFVVEASKDEDATAKITVYSPLGYGVTLGQPVGSKVGNAVAALLLTRLGGGTAVVVQGNVTVGNPSDWTAAAAACTGTVTHEEYLVLEATLLGTQIRIPLFLDTITAGPEASFASAKIQVCFQSPYVDPAAGGAPSGAQLVAALFTISGVFRNPGTSRLAIWPSLFTPFVPGTATPNAAGTVESRAVVPIPLSITFTAKRVGRRVKFSGRVLVAGKPARAPIDLYAGAKKDNIDKRVATTTSAKTGSFTFTRTASRKTTFFQAVFGPLDVTGTSCGSSRAPGGCVSATTSELDSRVVRVAARKSR
jgi:hypothetical protein